MSLRGKFSLDQSDLTFCSLTSICLQSFFNDGNVRWTGKQHRFLTHNGGFLRRVGARVCDAGICEIEYGGHPRDLIAEDSFAYSEKVTTLAVIF